MHSQFERITVKQLIRLLMRCGLKKCELWKINEYILVHSRSKAFRRHLIASKKMDLLHEAGLAYNDAQRLVIMEGTQKVNKRNLSLLGTSIWTGTINELYNQQSFCDKFVCDCHINGLFRNKIQIIIEDDV